MNIPSNRGARIQAFSKQPSIDLAKLIEVLAESINPATPDSRSPDPKQRPLFAFDSQRKRLKICTSGVLLRLFSLSAFKEGFKQSESGGFVQDFEIPNYGLTARLGGQLTEGNRAKLPQALDNLLLAIIKSCPEDEILANLLLDKVEQRLKKLARDFNTTYYNGIQTAEVKTLAFASKKYSVTENKAVAKVISAVEQINAGDYFTKMCQAIKEYLQQQDFDEDDIGESLASLEAERNRIDSQITRFLNFLEDEALARVRLNITLKIMTEIAEIARPSSKIRYQLLANYVDRVLGLVDLAKSQGLSVDLTKYYGQTASFNLGDYLNQANFYACLAVWPEAKAQIFEEKVTSQGGEVIQREVSYRFRINGDNPETKKPAFDSRLEQIQTTLIDKNVDSSQEKIKRSLAQLIFFDSVIPFNSEAELTLDPEQLMTHFQTKLTLLNETGEEGIKQILADLNQRSEVMKQIAIGLVEILRKKGDSLLARVKQRTSQQFICVKRSIVEWSRLEGADEETRHLLVGSQNEISHEQIEWFNHLEINDKPEAINLLFSVGVTTQLSEHDLVLKAEEDLKIQAQRAISSSLLQVIWVPYEYDFPKKEQAQEKLQKQSQLTKEGNQEKPEKKYQPIEQALAVKNWALDAAIQIEYETRVLNQNPKTKGESNASQYHGAAISAFSLLVYVCLWQIIQRLKQIQGQEAEPFTTLMLRLQASGKENSEQSMGENYVYGTAQTIEALLNQDTPLRMQGITLNNLQSSSNADWVKKGTFQALLSAFPLRITTLQAPNIPKIGIISYASRPGDEHPDFASNNNTLLMCKSYTATAIQQPFIGYEIKAERTDIDILTTTDDLVQQRLIKEEIHHLKGQGCNHILLVSHAYGGRRLNRTANYNNRLMTSLFLEDLCQNFPNLTIYPLLKDVFPTTRLYDRQIGIGFEISHSEDHASFLRTPDRDKIRDLIPVYSFATLAIVGNNHIQRPQSSFCTYFLFSDQQVTNLAWTERARQHLLNADGTSTIHPCLISLLRGLHFLEAEKIVKKENLLPVLNPFSWINPTTKEEAGEVRIFQSRRKGQSWLSYPALLSHVSQVLHRKHQ